MVLGVVVICHNAQSYIQPCLDSILDACAFIDSEIIVIDNGSTDGSANLLERYQPQIQLIKNAGNRGVAVARNQGLIKAESDFVWILDIDTVVNREAIEGMLDFLSQNASVGLCGCRLVDTGGNTQDSCRKFPTWKHKLHNLTGFFAAGGADEQQFYHKQMLGDNPFPVDYLIGACQLFRRNLLEQIGLLDEAIFYGPEDADFCRRIHGAGWEVVYLPSLSITHHYSRSTNHRPFSLLSLRHALGLVHYWRKWGWH